jgi:23S rRNA pseudouridine955/2504/2580 synthase
MRQLTVRTAERGMRLGRFLAIHCADVAGPALAAALRRGGLTVDGRRARLVDGLAAGAVVRLDVAAPAAAAPAGMLSEADRAFLASITLYSDDALLVLDKPSGWPVHRGTRTVRDIDALLAGLADNRGERPLLVHRLDKETSGVLVAARTRAFAAKLGRAFAAGQVEKTYRAVLAAAPEPPAGRVVAHLKKIVAGDKGRVVVCAADDPDGRPAETVYEMLRVDAAGARVALRPLSGRQHQLRVHMAHLGCPILGDRLYAGPAGGRAARLMLHAAALILPHPTDGRPLRIEAPLPDGFA